MQIYWYPILLVTDRDPGPGKSRPFFSDYFPGPIYTKLLFVQDLSICLASIVDMSLNIFF